MGSHCAMIWTDDMVERLRTAAASGGRPAARAAFPDLRTSQVDCAIRRYVNAPKGDPAPLMTRRAIWRRMDALPNSIFLDGVQGLVTWKTGAHR